MSVINRPSIALLACSNQNSCYIRKAILFQYFECPVSIFSMPCLSIFNALSLYFCRLSTLFVFWNRFRSNHSTRSVRPVVSGQRSRQPPSVSCPCAARVMTLVYRVAYLASLFNIALMFLCVLQCVPLLRRGACRMVQDGVFCSGGGCLFCPVRSVNKVSKV